MAFTSTLKIEGLNKIVAISPKCKRYTLRDNGFEETKAGNFQLIRQLDHVYGSKRHIKFKMTVTKDLSSLKLSLTTENGLNTVDIYRIQDNAMIVEKFEFLIEGLIDRDVLIEVQG